MRTLPVYRENGGVQVMQISMSDEIAEFASRTGSAMCGLKAGDDILLFPSLESIKELLRRKKRG